VYSMILDLTVLYLWLDDPPWILRGSFQKAEKNRHVFTLWQGIETEFLARRLMWYAALLSVELGEWVLAAVITHGCDIGSVKLRAQL
jgi:hypothetical protein